MIPTLSLCADNKIYGAGSGQDQRIDGSMPVWSATGKDSGKTVPCDHAPFGFHDLLNMVNPLQHIPVVQNIYRAVTGDQIAPESQVLGDTLYGGPLSGAASLVNVILGAATGKDMAGHVESFAFHDAKGGARTNNGADDDAETIASIAPASGPALDVPLPSGVSFSSFGLY